MGQIWKPIDVKNRFEEAAQTIRRLPGEQNIGYQKTRWPYIYYNKSELFKQEPTQIKFVASPEAIDRLDDVLGWSYWVVQHEIEIIWAKAEQKPWKIVCKQCGVSRSTGARYWESGILKITNRLNNPDYNNAKQDETLWNTEIQRNHK